jgi:hypothetical protein
LTRAQKKLSTTIKADACIENGIDKRILKQKRYIPGLTSLGRSDEKYSLHFGRK